MFYFFEVWKSIHPFKSYDFIKLNPNLLSKILNCWPTWPIFGCYPYFWRWNWMNFWDFFDKKYQTLMAYNFWTTGWIFKLKKCKSLKMLSSIPWIWIRIWQNELEPDPLFKVQIHNTARIIQKWPFYEYALHEITFFYIWPGTKNINGKISVTDIKVPIIIFSSKLFIFSTL